MIKSVVSMLAVLVILVGVSFWEAHFITSNFNDFREKTQVVYQKVEDQIAVIDDVYALQDCWLQKKAHLHSVIPHAEIKEMDLWISETAKLVQNKEWTDAISKLEVLLELSEQIPKTFSLRLDNIL